MLTMTKKCLFISLTSVLVRLFPTIEDGTSYMLVLHIKSLCIKLHLMLGSVC